MKHKIQVSKTAIYYSEGNLKTAKTIWIVLHGYGMLANFFIRKFHPILNESTCVIAPEGLSKFYNKGFNGRVGATWMTKQDRTEEIEDYIAYLDQFYKTIISENNVKDVKINIVGFSQGGATASRWVANKQVTPNNFILWASAFPDEINLKKFDTDMNTFILFGDDDEFISEEQIAKQKEFYHDKKFNFKFIPFKGNHNIPKEVLVKQTLNNNWQ